MCRYILLDDGEWYALSTREKKNSFCFVINTRPSGCYIALYVVVYKKVYLHIKYTPNGRLSRLNGIEYNESLNKFMRLEIYRIRV